MLSRRLRLPRFRGRQWRCYSRPTDARKESSSSPISLYDKLFPSKKASEPATTRRSRPVPGLSPSREHISKREPNAEAPSGLPTADDAQREEVLPPGDDLGAWFGSLDLPSQAPATDQADSGGTVLVINNVSRSLAESDFYRLAPQGQHVEGWAGGITKVVQSLSIMTREPQGQYFLFFDTRAAAEAYGKEVARLALLARGRLPRGTWPDDALPRPPAADAQAASDADLHRFTLCPPTASLEFSLLSTSELAQRLRKPTHFVKAFRFAVLDRPDNNKNNNRPHHHHHHQPHQPAQDQDPSPPWTLPWELVSHLPDQRRSSPSADPSRSVLLNLTSSAITRAALFRAITRDGAERNLLWRLAGQVHRLGRGRVLAFAKGGSVAAEEEEEEAEAEDEEEGGLAEEEAAEEGQEEEPREDEPEEQEEGLEEGGEGDTVWREGGRRSTLGYTRFVVSFEDAAEARRFARAWHRREMVDERTMRVMVVDATALW